MSNPDTTETQPEPHHPVTTYFVNNEVEQTHAEELLASVILEQAGYPPAEYRLIREKPRYEFAPTDNVKLVEGERFEALHRGPTPTS